MIFCFLAVLLKEGTQSTAPPFTHRYEKMGVARTTAYLALPYSIYINWAICQFFSALFDTTTFVFFLYPLANVCVRTDNSHTYTHLSS